MAALGVSEQFRDCAAQFAQRAHDRKVELDRRYSDLQSELEQVDAERRFAGDAFERLADYPIKIGIHYTCPHCWINNGAPVPMTPIVSKADKELFHCDTCHFELEIEP